MATRFAECVAQFKKQTARLAALEKVAEWAEVVQQVTEVGLGPQAASWQSLKTALAELKEASK